MVIFHAIEHCMLVLEIVESPIDGLYLSPLRYGVRAAGFGEKHFQNAYFRPDAERYIRYLPLQACACAPRTMMNCRRWQEQKLQYQGSCSKSFQLKSLPI